MSSRSCGWTSKQNHNHNFGKGQDVKHFSRYKWRLTHYLWPQKKYCFEIDFHQSPIRRPFEFWKVKRNFHPGQTMGEPHHLLTSSNQGVIIAGQSRHHCNVTRCEQAKQLITNKVNSHTWLYTHHHYHDQRNMNLLNLEEQLLTPLSPFCFWEHKESIM